MDIEQEIGLIQERNKKVEADKAWERSAFRVGTVVLLTYIITSVVFYFIGVSHFLLNALIPTTGYFLSTQSLPFVKRWWIKNYFNK